MAILLDEQSRVLVQGITGAMGRLLAEHMLASGTNVLAGVTPGKGGQDVCGIPVFNTVTEAKQAFPELNTSLIVVPPLAARQAALDAFSVELKLVVCFSEGVPMFDAALMIDAAKQTGGRLIGPGSIGVMSPGIGRIGPIGGYPDQVEKLYMPGHVGIISKSGGMTNETAWVIRQAGLGQSTVVGIGGEALIGTSFADVLRLFETDPQTKAVALFAEIGGSDEEAVAQLLKEKQFTKPLVVFVAGAFAEQLPSDIQFGHAGAIISQGRGTQSQKVALLKAAGAHIVHHHHELGNTLKQLLQTQEHQEHREQP